MKNASSLLSTSCEFRILQTIFPYDVSRTSNCCLFLILRICLLVITIFIFFSLERWHFEYVIMCYHYSSCRCWMWSWFWYLIRFKLCGFWLLVRSKWFATVQPISCLSSCMLLWRQTTRLKQLHLSLRRTGFTFCKPFLSIDPRKPLTVSYQVCVQCIIY